MHRKAFRNFDSMLAVDDLNQQALGIDRIIRANGTFVTIEEKTDYTHYQNIAFELESTKGRTIGWAYKDLQSDFFAYGFRQQYKTYYWRTTALLDTWRQYHEEWKARFGVKPVSQSTSTVCPVPIAELTRCITPSKIVTLPAPPPIDLRPHYARFMTTYTSSL